MFLYLNVDVLDLHSGLDRLHFGSRVEKAVVAGVEVGQKT